MPISINPTMMREIIMDHYNSPRNKRTPSESEGFQSVHMDSTTCVDNLMIYVKVENDIIVDACFDGVGCAISTASTDIMCDLIRDKSKKDANYIMHQYLEMIHEHEYDDSVLDEAIVFMNTSKQPARIKCACIGWDGLGEIIK